MKQRDYDKLLMLYKSYKKLGVLTNEKPEGYTTFFGTLFCKPKEEIKYPKLEE